MCRKKCREPAQKQRETLHLVASSSNCMELSLQKFRTWVHSTATIYRRHEVPLKKEKDTPRIGMVMHTFDART